MRKRPNAIHQVYNDGLAKFVTLVPEVDKYGTPTGEFIEKSMIERWYRRTGARAEDVYFARSLNKDINLKIAMRGNLRIDTTWGAVLDDRRYEIYTSDFNPKNNETIVSLQEVSDEG